MVRRIASSLFVASAVMVALVAAAAPPRADRQGSRVEAADASHDAPTLDAQRDGIVPDVLMDAVRGDTRDTGLDAAVPDCITWWTEARYRPFGYDHIVHIKSACAKAADCNVSTNVNPEVKRVLVPANASVEVYTFLVSPSREFTAYVQCKLR